MIKTDNTIKTIFVTGVLSVMAWWLMGNWVFAQEQTQLLHIYTLALDNDPITGTSLETQYPIVLDHFLEATADKPGTTIVAMVDLYNNGVPDDRDHIVVIEGGNIVERIHQLPTEDGTFVTAAGQYEYDMVSPEQVGGFIKWARATYGGQRTLFSYVGHGTFNPSFDVVTTETVTLTLDENYGAVVELPAGEDPSATTTPAPAPTEGIPPPAPTLTPSPTPIPPRPPLPWPIWMLGTTSAHTDAVTSDGSPQLLTPQILADALAIGTDNGANPFDVIDLVHCFSGSAEQYYEVAPYGEVIVGSPNYGYIAADAFGKIIETVDGTMNSATMADTIIAGYSETLEQANADWEAFGYEHPYVFSAVSGSQMAAVKTEVDGLANALMAEFESDPAETMIRLDVVQATNAIFYDTSLCAEPFVLSEADTLVDIGTLSVALQDVFINQPDVLAAAGQVDAAVADAVIAYQAQDGVPWFAGDGAQMWQLEDDAAVGMSMFAGLGAEVDDEGVIARPWQYNMYTPDFPTSGVYEASGVYKIFVGGRLKWITSNDEAYSWANVVERYWAEKMLSSTVTTVDLNDETSACLPQLEIVQEQGELTAETVIINQFSELYAGDEVTFGGVLNNEDRLLNALTMFRAVALDGTELFSTTISSPNLGVGRHWLEAADRWTAPATPFTVEMIVDANDHVIEESEGDNVAAVSFGALSASAGSLLVTLDEQYQVSTDRQIDLRYAWGGSDMTVVDKISCQFYQLVAQNTPLSVVPTYVGESVVAPVEEREPFNCPLPNVDDAPGAYQLVVELLDSTGRTLSTAAPVWVNYIPASAYLQPGEAHTFIFPAKSGDSLAASVVPSAQWVSTFLWEPDIIYPADDLAGIGSVRGETDSDGRFTLTVNNPCPISEQYSLEVTQSSSAIGMPTGSVSPCSLPLSVSTAGQTTHTLSSWTLLLLTGVILFGTAVSYRHMSKI